MYIYGSYRKVKTGVPLFRITLYVHKASNRQFFNACVLRIGY